MEQVDRGEPVEEREVALLARRRCRRSAGSGPAAAASSRSRRCGRPRGPPSRRASPATSCRCRRRPSARRPRPRRAPRRSNRRFRGSGPRSGRGRAGAPCRRPAGGRRRRPGSASAATRASRSSAPARSAVCGTRTVGDVLGADDPARAVADPERAGRSRRDLAALTQRPPSPRGSAPSRRAGRRAAMRGRRRAARVDSRRSRGVLLRFLAAVGAGREVGEARELLEEGERNRPDRTVAVLGDDEVRLTGPLGVLLVVVLVAVDERDDVGVLLDRARLAKVRQDRAPCPGAARGRARAARSPITGTSRSRARIFSPRLICPTCSTRPARGSSARISWM